VEEGRPQELLGDRSPLHGLFHGLSVAKGQWWTDAEARLPFGRESRRAPELTARVVAR